MIEDDRDRIYTLEEIEHIERTYDCNHPEAEIYIRAYLIAMQAWIREYATFVGLHRTCRLPKCRRMRKCSARRPLEFDQAHPSGQAYDAFPPCVDCDEKQALVMREVKRVAREAGD